MTTHEQIEARFLELEKEVGEIEALHRLAWERGARFDYKRFVEQIANAARVSCSSVDDYDPDAVIEAQCQLVRLHPELDRDTYFYDEMQAFLNAPPRLPHHAKAIVEAIWQNLRTLQWTGDDHLEGELEGAKAAGQLC